MIIHVEFFFLIFIVNCEGLSHIVELSKFKIPLQSVSNIILTGQKR